MSGQQQRWQLMTCWVQCTKLNRAVPLHACCATACLLRHLPRPASPTPCTQPTCQPSSGAPDTAAMAGVWRPISPSAPSSLARLQKELLRSSRPAASTFSSAGSLRLS